MRLLDLSPTFLIRKVVDGHEIWQGSWPGVVEIGIAEADGVQFLCPKCFVANGGKVGTHSVVCWRPRVPADVSPAPGRWEFEGAGLADLTLVAGSSSVKLLGGCGAHFYVRAGAIEMLPD